MGRSPQALVRDFHEVMGQPIRTSPVLPSEHERSLRRDLIEEEFHEFLAAEADHNLVEIADALADITYVIYGTAIQYGINLDSIIDEVHGSNMSKVDPDTGRVRYDDNGKVLKGDGYMPPDVKGRIRQSVADALESEAEDFTSHVRGIGYDHMEAEQRIERIDRLRRQLAVLDGHGDAQW